MVYENQNRIYQMKLNQWQSDFEQFQRLFICKYKFVDIVSLYAIRLR